MELENARKRVTFTIQINLYILSGRMLGLKVSCDFVVDYFQQHLF